LVAVQIDLRFCGHRLIVGQLRFGLIERRLIDVALDAEQRRSLLDCGAVLIIDGFQITWTRATRFVVLNGAVLPVRYRYNVTGSCTGCATATFGGGGATNVFLEPQLARASAANAASTADTERFLPDDEASLGMGVIIDSHRQFSDLCFSRSDYQSRT
jgi:hypothetical protein